MWRVLVCFLLLRVPACAVAAEAPSLPDDPALDRPVTLDVEDRFTKVLADLSRASGVRLAVDEHLGGGFRMVVCVRQVPLRAVLKALTDQSEWHWRREADGGYCLTGPVVLPPFVETERLIGALVRACPLEVRPPLGVDPFAPPEIYYPRAPMGHVYALLPKALVDVLEDGGEVPFTKLPAAAQALVRAHRYAEARVRLRPILNPRWLVPPERLALHVKATGQGAEWVLRIQRDPPLPASSAAPPPPLPPDAEWLETIFLPYQPLMPPPVPPASTEPTAAQAARDLARGLGVNLVLWADMGPAAGAPEGNTIPEMFESVLPRHMRSDRARVSFVEEDGIYRMRYVGRPFDPLPSPMLNRVRAALEAELPGYQPLLAMSPGARLSAILGPWIELWRSLAPEQRKPGPPIPVLQLTGEQQRLLCVGLQAQMVQEAWHTLEETLGGDLARSVVSLDFTPSDSPSGLGFPRRLQVTLPPEEARSGGIARLLVYGEAQGIPPVLRLLPASNSQLGKTADLEMQDASLFAVADRLSQILGAPVVAAEGPPGLKLAPSLKQRPVALLMHWVERHSGLQWSRREGVYVLAPPVPAALLTQNAARTLEILGRGLPAGAALTWDGVAKAVSEDDRALLDAGNKVPLANLSVALQDAIREHVANEVRGHVAGVRENWQLLERLAEARVRLDMVTADGSPPRPRSVVVEVPGLPSHHFVIPPDAGR